MHRAIHSLPCFGLALIGLCLAGLQARAQVQVFHDRTLFTAALAALPPSAQDDFEAYPLGDIALGDRRGSFSYTSDPFITQPAIVPGGNGGQALGGSPFGVFVGADSVRLSIVPSQPVFPLLRAFGADFLYAPSFDAIPADTYRLVVGDGLASGQFAGNLVGLDGAGGTFFLGIIADPSAVFTEVDLLSATLDPSFLIPAYQVDNLIYAAVPEPGALAMLGMAGVAFLPLARRRKKLINARR